MNEPLVIFSLTAWAGTIAQSWWNVVRDRRQGRHRHPSRTQNRSMADVQE